MTAILDMKGIEKRFGVAKALDNVDFSLDAGEIHALLGINGAGKSTLIKILSGVYSKDAGTIAIAGETVELGSPAAAIACGIASVQQHPELVGDFTGVENIFLGQEATKAGLGRRIDRKVLKTEAALLLKRFPIDVDLDQRVGEMPAVDREIVAILHALRRDDIRILILDEPTSTLTEREKTSLFQLMRHLKAAGIAIIYITHRLEEVFEIGDRFTVFRAGKRVATFTCREARDSNISIPELMLDEKPGNIFPPKAASAAGEALLEVEGLERPGLFSSVSFTLRRGEILGIFGLVGSGADELSKALFGVIRPDAGTIRIKGKPVTLKDPHDALRKGIFLVPGDRRTEGLTLSRNVIFNMTLAHLKKASFLGGLLKFSSSRKISEQLARRVALHPMTLERPASAFSGGNQQKIVIAKGLYRDADIYIFVEPTVGVDIGARATLYALMRELSQHAGVLVISSDCDEVHGVADRMIALYKGRPVAVADQRPSRDQLLSAGIMGARS
ncbi:sugar ABC transporter ATP-binding protein [Agrobacterium vitis]|uniref:sugar ABC transporter ATP-binding protein n=1 Tax=Agrobacterium vitis TaxID=373 RepID=UPI0015746F1C|nr:sugar ABC transporter ATP-binding protein [Agrobacterium vitis]NSZ19281.1 sugar ABC transporter ATP-binding protein [Agrobacterium vitis]QZO06792.1 sugar ABC transporter ATP-binding protein [Agrobacterium vitis]UJL90676.1 sugar ABC transporter ATP-binding protein [Agrobacterium vitis]